MFYKLNIKYTQSVGFENGATINSQIFFPFFAFRFFFEDLGENENKNRQKKSTHSCNRTELLGDRKKSE
jgi:hypothetical protein